MGKKTQSKKKGGQAIWLVAGVAVVAVAALIAISRTAAQPAPAAITVASDQEVGAVRNVLGQPDAKVTLTEWSDYL